VERLFDLLPLTREHYDHARMKGPWSIKAVLPPMAPDLDYGNHLEVQDGTVAHFGCLEAIDGQTAEAGRTELPQILLESSWP